MHFQTFEPSEYVFFEVLQKLPLKLIEFRYLLLIANSSLTGQNDSSDVVIQVAQPSQRDRAAGWVSYGQKWNTVIGREYFTYVIGLSSTTVT